MNIDRVINFSFLSLLATFFSSQLPIWVGGMYLWVAQHGPNDAHRMSPGELSGLFGGTFLQDRKINVYCLSLTTLNPGCAKSSVKK